MATKEFELIGSSCEPLTKEIATKFRDMQASPTERKLDLKRVQHLRKKMTENLGVTFHWATAEIKGKECRMNGQHSSTMLTEMNGEFPDGLYVHIDRYRVSNQKGLALLFRQFDDRKSSRGIADIAGAYQGLYEELREVPLGAAKLAIEGIAWHANQILGLVTPSGDDVWTLFERKQDYGFIKWLGELLTSKTSEMKKASLVAAMYSTYLANELKAKEFWTWVAKGGDFEQDHPTTMLDEWLMEVKTITDVNKRPKPSNYYNAGIYCYNAYAEDHAVKKVSSKTDKGYLEVSV